MLDEEVEVEQCIGNAGVVPNTGMGALDGLRILGSGDPAEAMFVSIVACLAMGNTKRFECIPADA